MPGKIPDRWEAYTPLGKAIEGTKFITFKVPLEKRITASLPEEEQFTPEDLVERIKADGQTLGLVIDLTNTKRYYPSQAMIRQDVQYSKIFTEGHVVPSDKVISKFFRRVDKFVNDAANADKLVGVHCTHGVNRTGYLVCRYMIDKLDFEPEKALEAYSVGRGYPVERENYIEDLKKGKRDQSTADVEEDSDDEEKEKSWEAQSKERRPKNGSWFRNGSKNWQDEQDDAYHQNGEFHNGHHPAGPPPRDHWGGREQWSSRGQRDAGWGSSLQNSSSSRNYGYSHRQSGGWGEEDAQGYGGWGHGYGQGSRDEGNSYSYGGWSQQGNQRQYGRQQNSSHQQRGQRYRPRAHSHRHTEYNKNSRRRPSGNEYQRAGWKTHGNKDSS